MSVKLSELLASSKDALESKASVFYECDQYDQAQRCCDYANALGAIAPALVEIAKAAQHFNEQHGSIESTHIPERCIACRLVAAMAEAGVTCD